VKVLGVSNTNIFNGMSRGPLEAYRIESVANFLINFHWRGNYVNYNFRVMYLLGMVESTQGIILLGKMRRHVTFGNVYWDFECVQT
jgi:hypothetical protein